MPTTVADVEGPLIRGARAWMAVAGLSTDPSATGSPNHATLDAISAAMDAVSRAPAVYGAPTDDEVAALPGRMPIRGLANLALLEAILQNWTEVTNSVQSRSESSSDMLKAITDRVGVLRKQYSRYFLAPVVGGRIRINSAQADRGAEL